MSDRTDREEVFEQFAETNPMAAARMTNILGSQYGREQNVEAAISMQTRVPRLDLALYGGLPSGVTEIFGPESCGKTAMMGALLAAAQQQGKETALCATEDLDIEYWGKLGVDTSNLVMLEAECAEDAVDMALDFVRGKDRMIGIDSITALRTKDSEGTALDDFIAWRHLIAEMLQVSNAEMHLTSAMVVTSQVRVRKSANPAKMFAGGTDTASRAVADGFAMRLELSREDLKDDSYTMVVNVITNMLGPPARYVRLPIRKGLGIDHDLDLVRVAAELGVVDRKGPWYRLYDGGQSHHGEEAAARALEPEEWVRQLLLSETSGVYQHLR